MLTSITSLLPFAFSLTNFSRSPCSLAITSPKVKARRLAFAISNFTSQYVVFGFKLKTTTNVGVEFYVKGKNGKEFSKVSKSSGQGSDFSISAFICSNSSGVQEAIESSFPKIAEMGMLSLKTGIISVRD